MIYTPDVLLSIDTYNVTIFEQYQNNIDPVLIVFLIVFEYCLS